MKDTLKTSEQYYQEAIERIEQIKLLRIQLENSLLNYLKSEIPIDWRMLNHHNDDVIFTAECNTNVQDEFVEITYYHSDKNLNGANFRFIVYNDSKLEAEDTFFFEKDIKNARQRWKELTKLANFK